MNCAVTNNLRGLFPFNENCGLVVFIRRNGRVHYRTRHRPSATDVGEALNYLLRARQKELTLRYRNSSIMATYTRNF